MVAYVEPYLERAKGRLKSDQLHDLRYACLELRLALEEIAYDKLKLRLKNTAPHEIDRWQPGRVIQQLEDLVDPHIGKNSQLFIKPEQGPGSEDEPTFVGESKGTDAKQLGKHWQKLGSFLHLPKPTKESPKSTPPPEPEKLKEYLSEVVAFVEVATSTRFDTFFSANVIFECSYCKAPISRTEDSLEHQQSVTCYNPECGNEHVVLKEGDDWAITRNKFNFSCKKCNEMFDVNASELQRIPKEVPISVGLQLPCSNCGAEHVIVWQLKYGLKSEPEDTISGDGSTS